MTSQVAPGNPPPDAAIPGESKDRELIAAAREGQAQAIDALYRRYSKEALGFARGMVRAGQDAEDLVQEAFTKTMRAMANGNGPHENFQAYFSTAVKSVATQTWSRNRRELPVEAGFLEATQGPVGDDRLDRVLDGGTNATVLVALQSLPERWQRALWYADVLQEPPRRIAPLMGIKPNAVSALVRRARTGLRTAYLDAAIDLALDESSS